MKCSSCGHVTRSKTSQFCAACGAALPVAETTIPAPRDAVIDLTEPAVPVGVAAATTATTAGTAPPAFAAPSAPPAAWPVAVSPHAPPESAAPADLYAPPPPYQPVPPPKPRDRRRFAGAGAGLVAAVAIVLGLAALGAQQERSQAIGLLVAGWVGAVVTTLAVLLVRGSKIWRVGLPVAVVVVLAAVSAPVLSSTCGERLGASANLRACDFAGEDLAGADLHDANLSGANLTGASLRGANLRGANLDGARLTGANATNAAFADANLTNAVLDDATLNNATFARATMRGTSLRRAALEGATFEATSLAGVVLDGAVLPEAVLAGADLSGASLLETQLDRAVLIGANFTGAKLDGARLGNATLTEANFERASLRDVALDASGLERARFRGATLDGAGLKNVVALGATFDDASLRDVDLTDATLSNASFRGATLAGVRMNGATLIGVKGLSDATLAAGLGVRSGDLAGYLTARTIRLEARDTILRNLGPACRGRGVGGTAAVSGAFHPLVILGGAGATSSWTVEAANAGWEPMATRFAQRVACADQTETVVQRCTYTEIGGLGRTGRITRYRNRVNLRVADARSGSTSLTRTFEGTQPAACPQFTSYQSNGRLEGSEVAFSTVKTVLNGQVGRVP